MEFDPFDPAFFGDPIPFTRGRRGARLPALEGLVARLGDWEVDEASIERNQLVPGRGVAAARVHFEPQHR